MHNSSRKSPTNKSTNRALPEVADREPSGPEPGCTDGGEINLSINPATEELEDLPSFKVFLKKNLRPQATPAGLLAAIYDRVDQIKAEQAG